MEEGKWVYQSDLAANLVSNWKPEFVRRARIYSVYYKKASESSEAGRRVLFDPSDGYKLARAVLAMTACTAAREGRMEIEGKRTSDCRYRRIRSPKKNSGISSQPPPVSRKPPRRPESGE